MDADNPSKALATSPGNSLKKLGISSVRQAYADRLTLSEGIDIVGKMLDACPHGRPANQKGYIGALANVLCQYPRMVASKCADPLNGVLRDTRFLPTVSDLVAWCEREAGFLRGQVERQDFAKHAVHEARTRQAEAVKLAEARKARPSLDALRAKYGPNWGIGQADDAADRAMREASAERMRAANETLLVREYAAVGEDPHEAAPGLLISRELRDRMAAIDAGLHDARMRRAKDLGAQADRLARREAAE